MAYGIAGTKHSMTPRRLRFVSCVSMTAMVRGPLTPHSSTARTADQKERQLPDRFAPILRAAVRYAFDLQLDGADLRKEPIERRQAILTNLLHSTQSGILFNDHIEGAAQEIFTMLSPQEAAAPF